MSRIGKLPVSLPEKVSVNLANGSVEVKGPKGTLNFILPKHIAVVVENNEVKVNRDSDETEAKSMHGMCRNQIANMVKGVSVGFTKELEINGVGYRAEVKANELHMALGFSHPVIYSLPEGISAAVDGRKTKLTLSGIDKQVLGSAAAKIRGFRPPEPYRGKGVKYAEEVIKRKEGKSAGK